MKNDEFTKKLIPKTQENVIQNLNMNIQNCEGVEFLK